MDRQRLSCAQSFARSYSSPWRGEDGWGAWLFLDVVFFQLFCLKLPLKEVEVT
ncbi:unknown protein [Desulfotalea psychrophila LSv54]|uniref:Uncharacterized protein n=1 Tax=Desulfotalea psychrophila (strain LSv54 / DSM 12343) TaxID=177439 RepID=Q6AN97_DESPS|nr:unknown protein [Desulfotalea psychrophila LSv54]